MSLKEKLKQRLHTLRDHIEIDPLSNPIRQVAHEISIALESGQLSFAEISALIKQLCDDALGTRASNLRRFLGLEGQTTAEDHLTDVIHRQAARAATFSAFVAHWGKRRDMMVFTAHPTFVLSAQQGKLVTDLVTEKTTAQDAYPDDLVHLPDTDISLSGEHEAVLGAITNAAASIHKVNRLLLGIARERFPDQWRSFVPSPLSLATWVGYDMDGRNDIGWQTVIKHRLQEKCFRLHAYLTTARSIAHHGALDKLIQILTESASKTQHAIILFSEPNMTPSKLAQAADFLTAKTSVPTSIKVFTDLIDDALAELCDDAALEALTLKADMKSFHFGAGEVHFRLNAAQIRNAARHALQLSSDEDLFGHKAVDRVQALIRDVNPVQVNFASLAIEQSSASRLFIAMAQILKHIDSDQPIRLLIAECENPVTILAAIYLAKQFGVDSHVDICPLFETAFALDRSRRILDVLFQQSEYCAYAKKRGRIAIQAGFSDAGRFMGQISANLAIERLQGHFSDLMKKHGLGALDAIIFDTHGESMGRGNHQRSLQDRALYVLSPWARQQFKKRHIHLIHETSYQGGDGYLLFGAKRMSDQVVASVLAAHDVLDGPEAENDDFYLNTSTSLDFYRKVKTLQEQMFADKCYHVTLSSLGVPLLPVTGSRKVKRQFEKISEEDASLRKIRAIPHNAILQQLGMQANIFGGIGQALSAEHEYFVDLAKTSDRFARLMALVARSKQLSELKVCIAYMKLFDGSFWATRPLSGKEDHLQRPCAILGAALSADNRYFAALQLLARLRSDSIALTRSLQDMGYLKDSAANPDGLDLLHAIRIALIQHLFILAAQLPTFSPQVGHTKTDVMQMIFALRIPEACALLREVFPIESPGLDDYRLAETATYPAGNETNYMSIHKDFIDPLDACYRQLHIITNGVSHYYGAIG